MRGNPYKSSWSHWRAIGLNLKLLWRRYQSLGLVVCAIILVLISHIWVLQSYRVDGSSMNPTLWDNDRLLVWKAGISWGKLTGSQFVPKRGDIIVFKDPTASSGDQDILIKRVIGLPNEQVTIRNNQITIYNSDNPDGFVPMLNIGHNLPPFSDDGVYNRLGDDEIFVIGDNRLGGHSRDSRVFSSPVTTDSIIGTLMMRTSPLDEIDWFF